MSASLSRLRSGGAAAADGRWVPDQQWDMSPGVAIFVVPADAAKPYTKYVDGVMESFTEWCNGSIYGVHRQTFTRRDDGTWAPGDSDECWDYIGYDYATEKAAVLPAGQRPSLPQLSHGLLAGGVEREDDPAVESLALECSRRTIFAGRGCTGKCGRR
jgi:hypothetical protein